MGEQIERLEDEAHVTTNQVGINPAIVQILSEKRDRAAIDVFEQIRATKQRRLARARGPDQTHHLVAVQFQRDAAQDFVVSEAFDDLLHR